MEDILSAYSRLKFNFLPIEWVESVWNTQLSEASELPEEYVKQVNDKDYYGLMNELTVSIKNWLAISAEETSTSTSNSSSQNSERNWATLSSKVDYRALICFLSTYAKSKLSELCDSKKSMLAFAAFRLYLILLSVPGADSINIFNPSLFHKMLKIIDSLNSLIKSAYNHHCAVDNSKEEEEIQTDEVDPDILSALIDLDIKDILHEICLLLKEMLMWLTKYDLYDESHTLTSIIRTLVELTFFGHELNILESCSPRERPADYIICYSYNILEQLCKPQHGDVSEVVLTIIRYILHHPVIGIVNSKISVKEYITTREHSYTFILKLLRTARIENPQGIRIAFQQICLMMPGIPELRVKVASDIVGLLKGLPSAVFKEVVLWIIRLAHTRTVEYRINGIELISGLLSVDETEINVSCESDDCKSRRESLDKEKGLIHKILLATIIGRCRDSCTLVRYKCLGVFANTIISNQPHTGQLVREIFIAPNGCSSRLENEQSFDLMEFLNQDVEIQELPTDPLPSGANIMNFIERLAIDKTVLIRKNALRILLNVCILDEKWISPRILKIFVSRCRDRSILVRKVLSGGLTDLVLKYPSNIEVIKSWVEGLIPLIAENETQSQEKVIELISKVIIDNIVPYDKSFTLLAKLPWRALSEIFQKNMRDTFRYACRRWSLQGKLTEKFFQILQSHIGTDNNLEVWFLIVNLTEFQDVPFSNEIYNYFIKNVYSASNSHEYLHQLVSEALFLNWRKLSRNHKERLYRKLIFSLERFSVPISLISRRMDICIQYKRNTTMEWCQKIIQLCEEWLRNNVSSNSTRLRAENLCRYIFTLGDTAQYSPGVNRDVIDLLAKLIDPDNKEVVYFKRKAASIRGKVSAVSIITLGKICMQDQGLARKYVPDLVKLLGKPSSMWEMNKINTIIALSDLCSRFTSVVKSHFGDIFITLKDSSIEVRKSSITMITQLMQDNYLKVDSPLFFYMLMMILDSSAEVRQIAKSFIVNDIVSKTPGVMSQFYVEAIFFFNSYEVMQGCSKDRITEREKIVFSMAGAQHFEERKKIYSFMLSNMQHDHRFNLSHQLYTRIFAQYLDEGNFTFDIKGTAVLRDAIYSLGCEEIHLEHIHQSRDLDEERVLECQLEDIAYGIERKAFLSQTVKNNYIKEVIPIIVQLKRKLAEEKSPLEGDLMLCFQQLLTDYRNEVDEILSLDSELAAEVELHLNYPTAKEKDLSESEEFIYCNAKVEEVEIHHMMSKVGEIGTLLLIFLFFLAILAGITYIPQKPAGPIN